MPPRDPKLCPALKRALPGDYAPGSVRVLDWPERWECEFGETGENGDPVWRVIRVRSRARNLDGRETILAEWDAGGSTWTEWYQVDAERMREA